MKILIYSANFAPEPTGIGKYSGEMAAWLAREGHEVRVIAAPPYYPQWKVTEGYNGARYSQEQWSGVSVHRAPIWVPRKLSGATRILHLLSFALSSLPLALRHAFWKPDVVLAVAPAIVCAPAGWLAARLSGATAWLHVQDFEIDVGFRLGMMKRGLLGRIVSAGERWLLRRFDRVSSISHRMLERAAQKGVAPDRLVFFPNWVDTDSIQPAARSAAYRQELGIPDDAIVALYSGTLGAKHGLQAIPAMASRLQDVKKLVFVICGDGVLKAQLQELSAGLPNVRFLPLQPVERLGELLAMADIQLLTQSPGAQDLVMPSKLGGMLASGRPIVATSHPGTEIVRVVHGRGIVVPPDDLDALIGAVAELAAQPEARRRLGAAARRYAEEHLARECVLAQFESVAVRTRQAQSASDDDDTPTGPVEDVVKNNRPSRINPALGL